LDDESEPAVDARLETHTTRAVESRSSRSALGSGLSGTETHMMRATKPKATARMQAGSGEVMLLTRTEKMLMMTETADKDIVTKTNRPGQSDTDKLRYS